MGHGLLFSASIFLATLANFAPMIVPFIAMAIPLFVQPLVLLKLLHMTVRRR